MTRESFLLRNSFHVANEKVFLSVAETQILVNFPRHGSRAPLISLFPHLSLLIGALHLFRSTSKVKRA